MTSKQFWAPMILAGLMLAGCSSTTLSGSWKSPDYTRQVKKVYIVGVSKQETNRRIFENEFNRQLSAHGVIGLSSYKDVPDSAKIDEVKIAESLKTTGADSVLMTNVTGQRTEEVVKPGRVSSYNTSPYYGSRSPYYGDRSYNRYYGSYYNQRREVIYEPATISQFTIVTVEANLYDAKTKEMIWSAQLETVVESDIQTLISDFVKVVIKDMSSKGLI